MRSVERNQKYWDGLHPFRPQCFTCWHLESRHCQGCTGTGSGDYDNYEPLMVAAMQRESDYGKVA